MLAYQVIETGKPLEGKPPLFLFTSFFYLLFITARQLDIPVPIGCQVLARTMVSGVCHTDVHVANGDLGTLNLPRVLGHEGVGIIEAIGPDVKIMKVGDRIGVPWLGSSCMNCYLCQEGRENMCQTQIQTGESYFML